MHGIVKFILPSVEFGIARLLAILLPATAFGFGHHT